MTKEDTIKLVSIITVAYPNFDKFKDEKHIRGMVNLWASLFCDDDSHIVALAVKQHIATSKWPPAVAEIREIMADIQHPYLLWPDQAWEAVAKVLLTEGEYGGDNVYSLLPRPVAEAVDAIGYGQLYALSVAYARGHASKAGLDRVSFIQAYEGKFNRLKKNAMLPPALSQSIVKLQAGDASQALLATLEHRYGVEKAGSLPAGWPWDGDAAPEGR